jgi:hypothetical protein
MATITTPVRIGPADNGRRMTISELQVDGTRRMPTTLSRP